MNRVLSTFMSNMIWLLSMPAIAQAAAPPSGGADVTVYVGLVVIILIYFIPSVIAFRKDHKNKIAIFLLNWFAFTVLLWLVALIWAVKKPESQTVMLNADKEPSYLDELEKLSELQKKGVITQEEFQQQKAKLLDQ